jgi:hypothetical protein
MLSPVLVEQMRKVRKCTIRFWFKINKERTNSFMRGFLASYDTFELKGSEITKAISAYFDKDTLSAFEIIDNEGNGEIYYLEWP